MSEAEYKDLLLQQLHADGLLDRKQADEVLDEHERTGKAVREIVRDMQLLDEDQILEVIAAQLGAQVIYLAHSEIPPEVVRALPGSVARMHSVVPVEAEGDSVTIAVHDLISQDAVDELRFVLGKDLQFVVAREAEVKAFISQQYGDEGESVTDMLSALENELEHVGETSGKTGGGDVTAEIEEMANQAPVIRFVNLILLQAVKDRASDIHFEPFEHEFKIRYRVDGALYEM